MKKSNRKILIVDDEPSVNEIISKQLSKHGYEPISAFTGEQALEMAKTFSPDLILLDLNLPDGKGELLYSMFENLPETMDSPVLIISAQDPERIRKIVDEKRIERKNVFPKPIDFEALFERIDFLLNRGRTTRGKRVLIADDDIDANEIMRRNMEKLGFETISTFSGFQTISAAKKHKPDLILLDINLPSGKGELVYTVLKSLKATKEIPIIIVSGQSPKRVEGMHLAKGIPKDDIFLKPIDFKSLRKRIDFYLFDKD